MPELPNAKSKRNILEDKDSEPDKNSETPSMISASWNENQEKLLKGISERSNCMRWLHNQCNLHFESLNFYFTIPNVVISTLNGGFTMSLTSLFPEPGDQKVATTIIGLISIFSGVLITMNQYMKSQQMMEAHRSAALSYGKLHRLIQNELALTRDQRMMALDFLKMVRSEQDRLENTSPSILPNIILKFNIQFENRTIEKPEIAGDLDETEVNAASRRHKRQYEESTDSPMNKVSNAVSQLVPGRFAAAASQLVPKTFRKVPSFQKQHDNEDRPDTPPLPGSQRNEVVVQIKDN
jgi:hypothetical protein